MKWDSVLFQFENFVDNYADHLKNGGVDYTNDKRYNSEEFNFAMGAFLALSDD